jgi:hypothetical protein
MYSGKLRCHPEPHGWVVVIMRDGAEVASVLANSLRDINWVYLEAVKALKRA